MGHEKTQHNGVGFFVFLMSLNSFKTKEGKTKENMQIELIIAEKQVVQGFDFIMDIVVTDSVLGELNVEENTGKPRIKVIDYSIHIEHNMFSVGKNNLSFKVQDIQNGKVLREHLIEVEFEGLEMVIVCEPADGEPFRVGETQKMRLECEHYDNLSMSFNGANGKNKMTHGM